jgi:protein-disulfide isomerase
MVDTLRWIVPDAPQHLRQNMSKHQIIRPAQRRGRVVAPNRSPLPVFYAILGLLAVLGVALLAISLTNRRAAISPSTMPVAQAVRPLSAPTGTTPDRFYYKGKPTALVKVIEYADFQCPACGAAFETIEPLIDAHFIATGKVQLIYHDFPLPQHANAVPAAAAARCAGEQGKFWAMHDLLFSRQQEWAQDRDPIPRFASYANALGLDRAAFEQCLASDKFVPALQQAATAALQQGVQATPTFVVNGTPVTADHLQAAIEAALAASGR